MSQDPAVETETVVAQAPSIRIVSGDPTPEEVAALVALLSAVGGGPAAAAPARVPSAWSDPAWRLVGPAARRDGWRTSALPR